MNLYSEDQLVEQPAIHLFAELGWQLASGVDEVVGSNATLGRETRSDVILLLRLRAALLIRHDLFMTRHTVRAGLGSKL